jgi:hypothetical protein
MTRGECGLLPHGSFLVVVPTAEPGKRARPPIRRVRGDGLAARNRRRVARCSAPAANSQGWARAEHPARAGRCFHTETFPTRIRWVRGQRLARGVLPPQAAGGAVQPFIRLGLRYPCGVGTSLERAQVRLYRVQAFASLDLPAALRPRRSLGLGRAMQAAAFDRGAAVWIPALGSRQAPRLLHIGPVRWAWSRWDRRGPWRTVQRGFRQRRLPAAGGPLGPSCSGSGTPRHSCVCR